MGFLGGIKKIKKYYDTARHQAKADYSRGAEFLEDAYSGMTALDNDLSNQIAGGGLTPGMERGYGLAEGAISDMVARSRRGMGADLLQTMRRSGGTLDANTALAHQIDYEGGLNEQEFGARRDVAIDRVKTAMQRTDKLYSLVAQIRDRKLGVSQSERNRAAQMWLGAIGGKAGFMGDMARIGMSGMTMGASGYVSAANQADAQKAAAQKANSDGW